MSESTHRSPRCAATPSRLAPGQPVVTVDDDPVACRAAELEAARRGRPLLLVGGGRRGADALVRASAHAALVVVGPGTAPPGRPGVGLAVAGAARCPVLLVPPTAPGARPRRDVVVGVSARPDRQAADRLLLQTAFAAASARGTSVLAVHAWQDTTLEPDRFSCPGTVDWGLLRPDEHRTLAEAVAGCRTDWPDVPLRQAVVRAPLGATLLATALSAQLLVLGVRRRRPRPAVRFLLHRPPCPVELVPVPGPAAVRPVAVRRQLLLDEHR
jgi:hypothetical protein